MQFDHVIMYLRKSREDMERERKTGEDTLQAHRERLSEHVLARYQVDQTLRIMLKRKRCHQSLCVTRLGASGDRKHTLTRTIVYCSTVAILISINICYNK